MASSDSSVIKDDKSVHVCDTDDNSSTDEKVNITIFSNGKRNKHKMTSEQYRQLTDKLFEMEQIKYEERLVQEQLNRLNLEKQHVQNLLSILHVMDSNDRIKNSRCRQRRLKNSDSNFHLN